MAFGITTPFDKTINARDVLNWLHSETEDGSLVCRFAAEWFDLDEEGECDACGTTVPTIDIDEETQCVLCGASLLRDFNVFYSFSVGVKAANRDDAERIGDNAVSVNVDESDTVSDNYDLEMTAISEGW